MKVCPLGASIFGVWTNVGGKLNNTMTLVPEVFTCMFFLRVGWTASGEYIGAKRSKD